MDGSESLRATIIHSTPSTKNKEGKRDPEMLQTKKGIQWYHGMKVLPDMNKIHIVCDSGGSNGWRTRLWKYQRALLADETGLELHVCHMPPGAPKWNKIEHRMFCYISKNWAGKPLLDINTVVNNLTITKSKSGLVVDCQVDYNQYE